MAESVIFIREHGIKSVKQLDEFIQKSADERQNLQDKIKVIDKEISSILSLIVLQSMFLYLFFQTKKAVRFYSNHLRYIPNIIALFQFFN